MGYIYMLTSPSGKIYIGQTIRSIEKRFKQHQQTSSTCVAIYNAIKYHGWENFETDWYECPDEDLNFDEELLVREMGTLAPSGYNLKEGGGNGKLSEETKQKIGEAQLGEKSHMFGKTLSDETKQKLSEAKKGEKSHMFGKPKSDEIKQKIREANLGKTQSEKTIQKRVKSNTGKIRTEETKQKMKEAKLGEKNTRSKKVYRYAINGTYVDTFNSVGEAGRYLNKDSANIGKCARGEEGYETAYKFKWSYTQSITYQQACQLKQT
jgi:group I intron endonuclease